jgi:hypothetical protein
MAGIVWLVSYPKSGNTWLRAFLSNLWHKDDGPADINSLSIPNAADRKLFDETLGQESSDMTLDEVERARPSLYRALASGRSDPVYLKLHDAYLHTAAGEPLIPSDATSRAVYIVRNPLDVVVSFADHLGKTIDATIDCMADRGYAFAASRDRLPEQLEQRLLSWSGHALSWLGQTEVPVHLMRYEDMLGEPVETFSRCLEFLDPDVSGSEIERALAFSSFSALSAQERASGFRERSPSAKSFFRKGRAGGWRDVLSDGQRQRILEDHGAVMRRLNYLRDDGSPCF